MVMKAVCDAWITELTTHVAPVVVAGTTFDLSDAKVHRYASWSSAAFADSEPGLHLAVWPDGDPDARRAATTDGADWVQTKYRLQVWVGAVAEETRVFDDDDANAAWLALYEAVKARFYVRANIALGDTGSDLHYQGGRLLQSGDQRVFEITFSKVRAETLT
jgi:hypothetical protein